MRITIVMGFFLPMPPAAGGATEKSWSRLAVEFAQRGHEVTIVSRSWTGWPDREMREGVKHLRIPGADHTDRLGRNLWRDLRWSFRAARALPPADVTVVNCIALPAWLGWKRGAAGRVVVMPGRMPKGQYRLYRQLARVLAVSTPVQAAVLAENPRLAPITKVVGYPINWTRLAQPRAPRDSAGPVRLGYIGRIHREKGLELLVDALGILAKHASLPPWQCVFCGPTDVQRGGSGARYSQHLQQKLVACLPPGAFDWREPLFEENQLAELYQSLDLFCYPSLATEGETFGVAVAEAMAAGAAPIVSNLPCFRDFVRSGKTGEIFDHTATDAPERLAAILAALLLDPERRTQLARAAQASVDIYDFPAFARHLLEDFTSCQ